MQKRKLGNTNLELSVIGLGSSAFGHGWGPVDDNESINTVRQALDEGINWIDTAAIYGFGHCEQVIAKAIKQLSEKPIIATKCGLTWDKSFNEIECLKAESIAAECEASLKRLDIETIDLYQIHFPMPAEDIEQAWSQMTKLVEQGKVRYIGVSNFNLEQLERIQAIYPAASLQAPYNMINRQIEEEITPFCVQNNIGLITYIPMARGLLTGKFNHKRLASMTDDDYRNKLEDFQPPQFDATLELVDELKNLSRTSAQLAISWVLRRSEVTATIVGARRPEQIKETAKAADFKLTDKELEQIENLLAKRREIMNNA